MYRCLVVLPLFMCMLTSPLLAQLQQPARAEVDINEDDGYYTLLSAGEKGLLLFNELESKRKDGQFHLGIHHYDTSLQEQWSWEYTEAGNMVFTGYDYDAGNLYLLFGKGPYTPKEYKIVKVDIETRDTASYTVKRIIPIELTDFLVNGNTALFIGVVNYKPAVMHFNFETDQPKVLQGIYTNAGDLVDLKLDRRQNEIDVIISERGYNRNFTFNVKTYNEEGDLVSSTRLRPGREYSLLSGTTTSLSNGDKMIIGTYSERRSQYSQGVFMARISDRKQQDIRFVNYADLDNFFQYMRDKREDRIQRRIERKRQKGKEPRFNYRLMVHEIIEREGEYIVVAEAYYPRYQAPYPYFAGLNADWALRRSYRGGSNSDVTFDGYRYTHAIVLGFDDAGALLWDNSFEIMDVISFELEQYVSVSPDKDHVVLLYNYENVLRSKLIAKDEVIDGKSEEDIRLKHEDDEARQGHGEDAGLQHWYGKYFYAYGIQKIKNFKDGDVDLSREVFYINKITYK